MTFGETLAFFDSHDRFQGWRIGFFGYEFLDSGKQNVRLELYEVASTEHTSIRKVEIKLCEVTEVRSDFFPGQSHVISQGVHFSPSGNGSCVKFDGDFEGVAGSLDSIRRHSDCYVIGKSIAVRYLEQ